MVLIKCPHCEKTENVSVDCFDGMLYCSTCDKFFEVEDAILTNQE